MSLVGYAALVLIDFEHADVKWTIFEEEPGRPDPLAQAKALAKSVEQDWPNHEAHFVANERARDMQAERLLGGLLEPGP